MVVVVRMSVEFGVSGSILDPLKVMISLGNRLETVMLLGDLGMISLNLQI